MTKIRDRGWKPLLQCILKNWISDKGLGNDKKENPPWPSFTKEGMKEIAAGLS